MIIYYAHSMRDYRMPIALEVKKRIIDRYPSCSLVDPESIDWTDLVAAVGSHEKAYETVVTNADELVVLEHAGSVGKGVHDEVAIALRQNKPVWVFRPTSGVWFRVDSLRLVRELGKRQDWKVHYAKLVLSSDIIRQQLAEMDQHGIITSTSKVLEI